MKTYITIYILLCFFVTSIAGQVPVFAQGYILPVPGKMVTLSPAYSPAVLKGITLDADNPFRFHFYVDTGDTGNSRSKAQLKEESAKLIKYFLASLTIPEKDLWVNLSPYEKDRIIPQAFGQTEMGRDLLAQDYILKQITASLIYPESKLGKDFWAKVYTQAQQKFGTTDIPINTFNKVWIVPDKAVVYENNGTAFVLENHLKVMIEEDYLSTLKHKTTSTTNVIGSQVVRQVIIPALTIEVNEGENFSQLRQVFYSLILATWYKKKIKDSILNKIYSDRNKISGVIPLVSLRGEPVTKSSLNTDSEYIYQQYLKAFKKGVFNYIEDSDTPSGASVPRKYFSGGVVGSVIPRLLDVEGPGQVSPAQLATLARSQSRMINVLGDAAMTTLGIGEGENAYRVNPPAPIPKKSAYERPPLRDQGSADSFSPTDDLIRRQLLAKIFSDPANVNFGDTQRLFGNEGLKLTPVPENKVQDVYHVKDGQVEEKTHAQLAQQGRLNEKRIFYVVEPADAMNEPSHEAQTLIGKVLFIDPAMITLQTNEAKSILAQMDKPYFQADPRSLDFVYPADAHQPPFRIVDTVRDAIDRVVQQARESGFFGTVNLDMNRIIFQIGGSASYLRNPGDNSIYWPGVDDIDVFIFVPNELEANAVFKTYLRRRVALQWNASSPPKDCHVYVFPMSTLMGDNKTGDDTTNLPFRPDNLYFGDLTLIKAIEQQTQDLSSHKASVLRQYYSIYNKPIEADKVQKSIKTLLQLARMRGDKQEVMKLFGILKQAQEGQAISYAELGASAVRSMQDHKKFLQDIMDLDEAMSHEPQEARSIPILNEAQAVQEVLAKYHEMHQKAMAHPDHEASIAGLLAISKDQRFLIPMSTRVVTHKSDGNSPQVNHKGLIIGTIYAHPKKQDYFSDYPDDWTNFAIVLKKGGNISDIRIIPPKISKESSVKMSDALASFKGIDSRTLPEQFQDKGSDYEKSVRDEMITSARIFYKAFFEVFGESAGDIPLLTSASYFDDHPPKTLKELAQQRASFDKVMGPQEQKERMAVAIRSLRHGEIFFREMTDILNERWGNLVWSTPYFGENKEGEIFQEMKKEFISVEMLWASLWGKESVPESEYPAVFEKIQKLLPRVDLAKQGQKVHIEKLKLLMGDKFNDPKFQESLGLYLDGFDQFKLKLESRINLAHGRIDNDKVTLNEIVEILRTSIYVRSREDSSKKVLTFDLQGLNDIVMRFNRFELASALMNLLHNALSEIDHDKGKITVKFEQIDRQLMIKVTDNGPGIPADLLEYNKEDLPEQNKMAGRQHIFDLNVTTHKSNGGTGLGTTEAWYAIKDMGGTITVANRPEGGAEFTILLPLVDHAMQTHLMTSKPRTEGGINLNPAQMSMQVRKEGQDFKFNMNGNEIDAAKITGVIFTIRQMTPVTDLPQLLGMGAGSVGDLKLVQAR